MAYLFSHYLSRPNVRVLLCSTHYLLKIFQVNILDVYIVPVKVKGCAFPNTLIFPFVIQMNFYSVRNLDSCTHTPLVMINHISNMVVALVSKLGSDSFSVVLTNH